MVSTGFLVGWLFSSHDGLHVRIIKKCFFLVVSRPIPLHDDWFLVKPYQKSSLSSACIWCARCFLFTVSAIKLFRLHDAQKDALANLSRIIEIVSLFWYVNFDFFFIFIFVKCVNGKFTLIYSFLEAVYYYCLRLHSFLHCIPNPNAKYATEKKNRNRMSTLVLWELKFFIFIIIIYCSTIEWNNII